MTNILAENQLSWLYKKKPRKKSNFFMLHKKHWNFSSFFSYAGGGNIFFALSYYISYTMTLQRPMRVFVGFKPGNNNGKTELWPPPLTILRPVLYCTVYSGL